MFVNQNNNWKYIALYLLHFKQITLSEVPATSAESDAMSKDMKKRGFKFFDSTICYAHLQASGFVNDHFLDCICRKNK